MTGRGGNTRRALAYNHRLCSAKLACTHTNKTLRVQANNTQWTHTSLLSTHRKV